MPIKILPYNPAWPDEFQRIGTTLRQILGDHAIRIVSQKSFVPHSPVREWDKTFLEIYINHIGSTSVAGLAAKDIIDLQISVAVLTPTIATAMADHGFTRRLTIDHDHKPPSMVSDRTQWTKWLFHELRNEDSINPQSWKNE